MLWSSGLLLHDEPCSWTFAICILSLVSYLVVLPVALGPQHRKMAGPTFPAKLYPMNKQNSLETNKKPHIIEGVLVHRVVWWGVGI